MARPASTVENKQAMRSTLRKRRRSLAPAQQLQAARSLVDQVTALTQWHAARTIAVYLSNDGEIDPSPLAHQALREGKHLLLPVLGEARALRFAYWQEGESLQHNRYDIPEPAPEAPRCEAEQIDIICLPLVAWDTSGGRLGMGGGYYDHTLAGVRGPLLVGLAHDCQQVPQVAREEFDVLMHYVATDTTLIACCSENI